MTRQGVGAAILAILALLFGVALLVLAPGVPIMEPDSPGYIAFDPGRTAAYPAFIHLVGLANLIGAQVALYAAAAFVLA